MRVIVGGLIAGVILYFVPGQRSGPACVAAGALSAMLLLLSGPRSIVEKVGVVLIAAAIAWVAGPRAAYGQSLFAHLIGWTAAGTALAFYLHPKAE
jgi:hypothetical protein